MSKILPIALVLALLFNAKVFGQIEGIVTDKKKLAIADATIIASDTTGKGIDTVTSDKRGAYTFKSLNPGKYNVEAKASGFQAFISKSIIVTTPPEGTDESDDTYYAIRLDIVLTPTKN